ncbi:hypothetical protein KXX33_005558 [Aspergillus fumigatus]|nr:hypothetical protein KXX48_003929 [Aspergillus fumigatus]KAH1304831.1 hypothetical protein KXX66_003172 [Aspergillus fumigatus]KAH1319476.1 hypothetical protein KXX38_000605 [Aspergillus fumigatus]KAH1331596.1 hypothetical protein KXX47_004576 [Aspergillus fumigatus]KAH1360145.1 hypothetical protein KXX33_005558 [Aspergillus fumigatus]
MEDIPRRAVGADSFDVPAEDPIYPFGQLASPNDDQLQDFLFRTDWAFSPASLHRESPEDVGQMPILAGRSRGDLQFFSVIPTGLSGLSSSPQNAITGPDTTFAGCLFE